MKWIPFFFSSSSSSSSRKSLYHIQMDIDSIMIRDFSQFSDENENEFLWFFFLFLVYKNSEEENYMDIIILSERILNECHVSVVWWSSSSFVCVGEKKLTFFFSFQFFFHSVEIEIRFFLFIWKLGVKFTFISVYLMTWIKLKLYSDQDDDDLDCEKLLSEEKNIPCGVILVVACLIISFVDSIRFEGKILFS